MVSTRWLLVDPRQREIRRSLSEDRRKPPTRIQGPWDLCVRGPNCVLYFLRIAILETYVNHQFGITWHDIITRWSSYLMEAGDYREFAILLDQRNSIWHTRIFDQGEFKALLESSSVSTITYCEVRLSFQPWTWKLKNWVRERLFCLDKRKSWTSVIKQLIQHGDFVHWSTSLGGTVCPDHHLSNHWVPAPCLDFWQPSADSDPPTNTLVVRHPAVSPTQVQFQDVTPWNHTWTDAAHFDFSAF